MRLQELIVMSLVVIIIIVAATLPVATADDRRCYTRAEWDSLKVEYQAQMDSVEAYWRMVIANRWPMQQDTCKYDSVRLDLLRWIWPMLFLCDPMECRSDSDFAEKWLEAYKEARR